jgi:hypothetical protein
MHETAMAPMVVAVAPPKALRQLAKGNADVKDFAKRVEVARDRMPLWPAAAGGGKELAVMAETSQLFTDLFGDARVQAVVGREPAVVKYLRSIVMTSEGALGNPKTKMLFTFGLPAPGGMEELRPCLVSCGRGVLGALPACCASRPPRLLPGKSSADSGAGPLNN